MNKKLSLAIIIGILIIGAAAYAYNNNLSNQKEAERVAMEKQSMEKDAVKKEDAMKKDDVVQEADAMKKDDVMTKSGSYVTLADYNANTAKYADSKKV